MGDGEERQRVEGSRVKTQGRVHVRNQDRRRADGEGACVEAVIVVAASPAFSLARGPDGEEVGAFAE